MITEGMSKQKNNKGFSLVELIIVVSILAIAAIPLMRSMSLASRTNAKAQSMQNATSLAESIMEEMKSKPISVIDHEYNSDHGFTSGKMSFSMAGGDGKGISATQGEKFIATVEIRNDTYSVPLPSTTPSKKDRVKAANSIKLPKIEEVDSVSQAVLSDKDLNKYDMEAQNYFNQQKADYDAAHPAVISKKTIDIIKEDNDMYLGVDVTAKVKYESGSTPPYVRDLYSGTFIDADGTNKMDSNIYIFYKRPSCDDAKVPIGSVVININDASGYSVSGDVWASHKVYFIRQDRGAGLGPHTQGPVITFSSFSVTPTPTTTPTPTPTATPTPIGSFSYNPVDIDDPDDIGDLGDLDANGSKEYGKIKFITNLDRTSIAKEGRIYDRESRDHVYEITVVLKKPDDATEYARLNSTINMGITPTPTPAPT